LALFSLPDGQQIKCELAINHSPLVINRQETLPGD
jgi:hypothetical protein